MISTLPRSPCIDWAKVTSLHLDEYREIRTFGQWLADHLPEQAAGRA